MRLNIILAAALGLACALFSSIGAAQAQCALPYSLTNGQVTNATQVMANFNAVVGCITPGGSTNALQYNAGSAGFGGIGPLTNGKIVIGSTGYAPQAATITAGPGITITNGPGTITVAGGNGTPPTLVQSAFTRITTGSSGTVTLSSTPTVGNLLVAFASGFGTSSSSLGVPSPFYGVFANINNVAGNQAIVIGARVVQSGDGTSWTGFTGGDGGDTFGIFELSGAHSIQAFPAAGTQSSSTWPFFAGSAVNAYTFFVLENDSTNGYSSISGASLLYDGTNTAANHPSVIATIAAASAANATVTYTGSSFGNSLFTTVAITP